MDSGFPVGSVSPVKDRLKRQHFLALQFSTPPLSSANTFMMACPGCSVDNCSSCAKQCNPGPQREQCEHCKVAFCGAHLYIRSVDVEDTIAVAQCNLSVNTEDAIAMAQCVRQMRKYCHACSLICFPTIAIQEKCHGCPDNCGLCPLMRSSGQEFVCEELSYATAPCSQCRRLFCASHLLLLAKEAKACVEGHLDRTDIKEVCHSCVSVKK